MPLPPEVEQINFPAGQNLLVWFTLERVAWGVLLLLAFLWRYFAVGGRPLSPEEAKLAWPAYAVAHSKAPITTVGVSPLLFSGQWLLFSLFQGSAFLARFWPALAGVLVVWLPYRLRHRIGREPALLAGLLLLLSAHQVFLSRLADGAMLALAAALWLFADLLDIADGNGSRFWTAAIAFAALLIAAPESYTLLIALAVAAWPLAGVLRRQWQLAGAVTQRRAAVAFAATFFLAGTLFCTRLSLLGAAWEMFAIWGKRLTQSAGYPWYWLPLRLLADEPLLTVAALFTLPLVVRQWRQPWNRFLLAWAALFLVAGFLPGHSSREAAFLTVPLAFWAGRALWLAWRKWLVDCHCLGDQGYAVGFSVLLLGTAAVVVSMLAEDKVSSVLPMVTLPFLLMVVIVLLQGFWFSWRSAIQVLLILALLSGGVLTFATSWRDNEDKMAWTQPAFGREAVDVDAAKLVSVLEQASAERVGDAQQMPVVVAVGPELTPFLLWELRGFQQVSAVAALPKQFDGSAVITGPEVKMLPGYFGGKFILTRNVLPSGPNLVWIRWLLYRLQECATPGQQVILWLQPRKAATTNK